MVIHTYYCLKIRNNNREHAMFRNMLHFGQIFDLFKKTSKLHQTMQTNHKPIKWQAISGQVFVTQCHMYVNYLVCPIYTLCIQRLFTHVVFIGESRQRVTAPRVVAFSVMKDCTCSRKFTWLFSSLHASVSMVRMMDCAVLIGL